MSAREPEWEGFEEGWRTRLAGENNRELVASLNREVGNAGWVSIRGLYLRLLRAEVHKRGWDLSSVNGLNAFPGRRKFILEGGHLLYAPEQPPDSNGMVVPTGLERPARKGKEAHHPAGGSNTRGSAGEAGPLVKVLRCSEDGVRVSALFRDMEGLFVQDRRGRKRRSTADDILDAISRSASLRDVRAEEMTIVVLGREAPAEEAVARRLRLLDPHKLADEQPVDVDTEGLAAPEAELAETINVRDATHRGRQRPRPRDKWQSLGRNLASERGRRSPLAAGAELR